MMSKGAESAKMEVMSTCERGQLPWILHVSPLESAEREAKQLRNDQLFGIGVQFYIKYLSHSKIQYNWPAAGPSCWVALFLFFIQFSSDHGTGRGKSKGSCPQYHAS